MSTTFDLGLGLEGTHVMITGAAGQIGQLLVTAFLAAGSYVSGLDIAPAPVVKKDERLAWFTVDVTVEQELEDAFRHAELKFKIPVSACVAAAGLDLSFIPHHASICDMPLEQWKRTLEVNTTGTFLTARAWLRCLRSAATPATRNASLIVLGSEAGVFGVPGNADYATSKAGIQYGLVRSIAPEATRILSSARVNAIAPAAVDTPQFRLECAHNDRVKYLESEATVASRRSIAMEAVAKTCLTLTSDNFSGGITGQIIQIDGGKSGRVLWYEDGRPAW